MQTTYRNYRNYSYQRAVPKQTPKPPHSVKAKLLVLCFCMFLTMTIAATVLSPNSPDENKQVAGSTVAAEPESKQEEQKVVKKTVDLTSLQPELAQIIKKYPYDTSISVIELNSGTLVQAGDSYPYVAASTTKLVTALLYLHNVETGEASLDDNISGVPARDLLQKMINRSDNPAWDLLNRKLTRTKMMAYSRDAGLTSYDYSKNVVTSNDMATLLSKLYKGELINQEHTNLLLSWMQNTSEERFIAAAVPSGVKVYHKAGYLTERAHDVAIIDNGSTPFVVVIYSKSYTSSYDFVLGQKLFKEATTHLLDKFQ